MTSPLSRATYGTSPGSAFTSSIPGRARERLSTLSNCARGAMNRRRQQTGGRNVPNDLGKPKADEHRIKAKLVFKIDTILKERGLKQVEAAGLIGIRQPDVSKMLRGEFRQFSVERLLRFLVALDQDVEILVKPHRDSKIAPALHVF